MHRKLSLAFTVWLAVTGSSLAIAGEASGQMAIKISIQPGCEVSSRVDAGLHRVEHRSCSGVSAYKVNSGRDEIRPAALARTSVDQTEKAAPQIVTIYW